MSLTFLARTRRHHNWRVLCSVFAMADVLETRVIKRELTMQSFRTVILSYVAIFSHTLQSQPTRRQGIFHAALALSLLSQTVYAVDDLPPVLTTHGTIHKVEKDSITIKPRSSEGKFEKDLVIKLTGTSRISSLSTQKRSDKPVLVQKDIEPKHLVEKQLISVIYANNGEDHVLLAAVVQTP